MTIPELAALIGIFANLMVTIRIAYMSGQKSQLLDDHNDRIRKLEEVQVEHTKRISGQAVDIGKIMKEVEMLPRRATDRGHER